jgi:hypothetical protein
MNLITYTVSYILPDSRVFSARMGLTLRAYPSSGYLFGKALKINALPALLVPGAKSRAKKKIVKCPVTMEHF